MTSTMWKRTVNKSHLNYCQVLKKNFAFSCQLRIQFFWRWPAKTKYFDKKYLFNHMCNKVSIIRRVLIQENNHENLCSFFLCIYQTKRTFRQERSYCSICPKPLILIQSVSLRCQLLGKKKNLLAAFFTSFGSLSGFPQKIERAKNLSIPHYLSLPNSESCLWRPQSQ